MASPCNAILVANDRLGEFINGVTGQTATGATPTGIHSPVAVLQTTWKQWRDLHPTTQIMGLPGADGDFSKPLEPKYQLPGSDPSLKDSRHICMVATTQPLAVPSEQITDRPLNLTSGPTSLLLVRINGFVRAYDRDLPGDLVPRFCPHL